MKVRIETFIIKSSDSSGCPCNIDCQSGCSECDHPVCQCADKKENDQWNKCIDTNGAILGRCFDDCADDESCEAICTAEFKQNQKRCPCEVFTQSLWLKLCNYNQVYDKTRVSLL